MSLSSRKQEPFPYEIKYVNSKLNSQCTEDYTGGRPSYVQVGPQKWFLPSEYAKEAEIYYNFEFRKDDVVIVTIPRSGTTLTNEMVWLLCNDFNYKKASEDILLRRFPTLEYSVLFNQYIELDPSQTTPWQDRCFWKIIAAMPGKRCIQSHLPLPLLPSNLTKIGCKVIYVARNPRDMAVSYYHFHKSIKVIGYTGDFRKYWDFFERNLKVYTPYWEHVKEGWNRRNEENVLFMFYEDITKDLTGAIGKIATFLGKSCTDKEMKTLEEHLNIENFRNNRSVNITHRDDILVKGEDRFIRKGITGGWKTYFDEELEKRANEWIEKNLKDTDLRFPI